KPPLTSFLHGPRSVLGAGRERLTPNCALSGRSSRSWLEIVRETCSLSVTVQLARCCFVTIRAFRSIELMISLPAAVTSSHSSRKVVAFFIHGVALKSCDLRRSGLGFQW